MTDAPKPRGRPRKEGLRENLTLRIRADIRGKLSVAAEESGRSLSEEAERRIEETFNLDSKIQEVVNETINQTMSMLHGRAGSKENFYHALYWAGLLADSLRAVEEHFADGWVESADAKDYVRAKMRRLSDQIVEMVFMPKLPAADNPNKQTIAGLLAGAPKQSADRTPPVADFDWEAAAKAQRTLDITRHLEVKRQRKKPAGD